MRLIDADTVVTIQTYDDMCEEWKTETMTVAEAMDKFSDEGCPPIVDVEPVRHGSGRITQVILTADALYVKWNGKNQDLILVQTTAPIVVRRWTKEFKMTKTEYDSLQNALSAHLDRVLSHSPLTRAERTAYENAVQACKSVVSKNVIKEWENNE